MNGEELCLGGQTINDTRINLCIDVTIVSTNLGILFLLLCLLETELCMIYDFSLSFLKMTGVSALTKAVSSGLSDAFG